jgi:hypothetical protein
VVVGVHSRGILGSAKDGGKKPCRKGNNDPFHRPIIGEKPKNEQDTKLSLLPVFCDISCPGDTAPSGSGTGTASRVCLVIKAG